MRRAKASMSHPRSAMPDVLALYATYRRALGVVSPQVPLDREVYELDAPNLCTDERR